MSEEELELQIKLIAAEAASRVVAADLLASSLKSTSDSSYLLRLLAFELLLKGAARIHRVPVKRRHQYPDIFKSLPGEAQQRILARARERMSTSADYSDVQALLLTFSKNFVRLRYPYETYEGLTIDAYRERGARWVASGARNEDADFVYHPEELYGLVFALRTELDDWLAARPS